MSWINSNATYKQNSKNDLSFYHGFSKTPVEPTSTGTAATTLANASTKSGHTVIGTEVWAEEIPWFGLVPSRAVAVTRLSGLTKLNDLVKVDGEGKIYKYIGADDAVFTEAEWSSFWTEVSLDNGTVLKNRHGVDVLRYYKGQPMQTLTTTNNASIDSKGYATRLFVNESDHTGQTSGGSVVSQFAAGTDNIKNGIPSVELNPKLYYNTTEKIAGTHYYDYNVSGTVLWNENVTSKGVKISCFRYIGKTVTEQLSSVDSTVKTHSNEISEIKDKLGLSETETPGTPTLGGRVTDNEAALRVLLGLEDNAKVVATESIQTTANSAASTAVTNGLAAGGAIAEAIATAKQEAISSAEVTITAGTGISIVGEGTGTTFEIAVDETVATAQSVTDLTARVEANEGAITALTTGETSVAKQIEAALGTANAYTDTEVGKVAARLTGEGDVAKAIEAAAAKGQQGITDAATAKSAADAAQGTANAAKATADTAVQTVTGDTYVKATKTGTSVTLETQISALDAALAAEGTTLANAIAAAKSAGEGAGSAAEAAQETADQAVADAAAAQSAADAAQGDATQALTDAAAAQAQADKGVADAATAQATAEAAQGTANTAVANAATAQAAADAAQDAADAAQADADALETRMNAAESSIATNTTAISDLKKVSLTKDSGDGLVKVSTVGTIGDGLQSISVEVSEKIVETTDTFDVTSTGSSNVEVKLTGTIANPSITVKGTDIASAADLTALTTKVDTHIASAAKLSIVVVDGLTDTGVPNVAEPETNKLYLVATGAESGTYAEWIYLGDGNWERIGTTATDLSEYAKTATVTPLIEAAQTQADKGVADAATAKSAADAAKAAADAAQADADALEKLVGTTTVGSQITSAINALGTGATQGGAGVTLTQTNGVVTLTVTSGVVAASGTTSADKFVKGETVHTAIATAEAAAKKHATDAIAALDATKESAGVKVVQVDGAITEVTVTPGSVAENNASVVTGGAVYTAIKAVSDLVGTTAVATQISDAIAAQVVLDKAAYAVKGTEKVAEDAASAAATAQETADAKIATVDAKTETYYGAPLVSATTDASKNVTITAAANKEWSVSDVTLTGDTIVEVINGKMMGTGPTIVIDDANLVNGESMFVGQTLMGTFVGNLGKLTNGKSMFSGCTSLVDFCADLGSLTDGTDMFKGCTLSEDSIIYIVDSLPEVTSGTICLGTAVSDVLKTEAVNKGWTVVVA